MITLQQDKFEVPGAWTHRVKAAPDRKYTPAKRVWVLPNTLPNRKFLLGNFLPNDFNPQAFEAATGTSQAPAPVANLPALPEWPADLLPHQAEGLGGAWGKSAFFFAHGMGSGKSRTWLELIRAYKNADLIDEAWMICPNSLIGNWHEQIAKWTPDMKGFVKVYGVLSLSAGKLPLELTKRSHGRLAVGVDESQRIKNAQAKRSKVMHEIGKHAGFRHCLTGTNVTKGIEDLYSQYNFLDVNILGYKSFYAFRNRYCQMGGFENKQIVGYQNINELMQLVSPFTHVVANPVELPPQTEEIRTVELSPEQKRLLSELKSQMQTEMAGTKLSVTNALAYYTRGAQILAGFFPMADGAVVQLPGNPKLDELIEAVESTDYKIVIFGRFKAECQIIKSALNARGIGCLEIKANDPTMQEQVNMFQEDDEHQCIVSTYAMGSLGFTLTRGKVLIEASGTFNFEEAVQARKRIHRIGQESATKVIRLMANSKLDRAMKDIADRKQNIADYVTNSLSNPKALLDLLG